MKANGILDILQGFLIGGALGITPLKFRTKDKVTLIILLDYHGKFVAYHAVLTSF
jgi:hypothetical protein